jgi:excisionase family DNA binding protein
MSYWHIKAKGWEWYAYQPRERGRWKAANGAKGGWSGMIEGRWLLPSIVDEIADHLDLKRDTVHKWIGERQVRGRKVGRLWKFNRKELDEWVKSGGA